MQQHRTTCVSRESYNEHMQINFQRLTNYEQQFFVSHENEAIVRHSSFIISNTSCPRRAVWISGSSRLIAARWESGMMTAENSSRRDEVYGHKAENLEHWGQRSWIKQAFWKPIRKSTSIDRGVETGWKTAMTQLQAEGERKEGREGEEEVIPQGIPVEIVCWIYPRSPVCIQFANGSVIAVRNAMSKFHTSAVS